MTGMLSPHGAHEVTIGATDLEKGKTSPVGLARKDSAFPRIVDESNEGGSAGSMDTRSLNSRR
jgi:hypothetical protein